MTDLLHIYGQAGLVILSCLILLWVVSVAIENASIIDIFWGPGFVICNWVTLVLDDTEVSGRQWLVHALVTLWGLRLGVHLFIRNAGQGEDFRYRRWREHGGRAWWFKSLYRIYLFQGVMMLLVAAPIIVVNIPHSQNALGFLDVAGTAVWLTGFCFEVVGDQQLILFKRDAGNQGRVLGSGLWRYSLHPNYFGDALQWWGVWIIVAGAPWGGFTIISPILMTAIFVFVSDGVLERALSRSRPDYRAYMETTGRFFPRPPRK